jgi:hypothetical protein
MDALLASLGYAAFVSTSLVLGLLLLLLWRRTRQTPELAIAATLICAALAFALAIAAYSLKDLPHVAAVLLETLSSFSAHLSSASLALATRLLFRREARWARRLQISITLALAATFALRLVDPLAFPPPALVFWTYTPLGAFVYAWAAWESFGCWAALRRRAPLDLADRDLARRFLLWGIAGTSAVAIFVIAMVDRASGAGSITRLSIVLMSALGLVAAVGISFAFFPRRSRAAGSLAEDRRSD